MREQIPVETSIGIAQEERDSFISRLHKKASRIKKDRKKRNKYHMKRV